MVREELPEGDLLWHSDDPDAPGFLVASGSLVERSLAQPTKMYGTGAFAARIEAVVQGRAPEAVLRVAEDAVVYRLHTDALREFLLDHPGLYLRLLARMRAEGS